jgi:hypothetical protein
MGVLTFFIYLLLKNHYFWNIGDSQIETPFWTISHKIERNVLPITHLFNLYTWELNFGQTIWDKSEVLFGEQLGNLWNYFKTSWGHTRNIMKTIQKLKNTSSTPSQMKKIGSLMNWWWASIGYVELLFT